MEVSNFNHFYYALKKTAGFQYTQVKHFTYLTLFRTNGSFKKKKRKAQKETISFVSQTRSHSSGVAASQMVCPSFEQSDWSRQLSFK